MTLLNNNQIDYNSNRCETAPRSFWQYSEKYKEWQRVEKVSFVTAAIIMNGEK